MSPPPTHDGSASADLTGRILADRYRLERVIAAGGMATVWEATDRLLSRRVAVKILHPHLAKDHSFVKRFRGEAIAAARLAHPAIVSIYDTLAEGPVNAIVMELVSGTTLRADLDEHGPLQLNALIAIGSQVADALGAAHAAGLVHRDVKPANILLSSDGRVLVTDFGIAKAAEGADLTEAGSMVGTAKYLSPEQVTGGSVDGRSDLYSLGIVLYESLTGRAPFVADNDIGTALARIQRDPDPIRRWRPDVPDAIESVVVRAMQRDPNDRFPDATAMRRSLLAAGADAGPGTAVPRPRSTGHPNPTAPPRPPSGPAPRAAAATAASTTVRPAGPAGHGPSPTATPRPMAPVAAEPLPAAAMRRRRWPWMLLAVIALAGLGTGGYVLAGGIGEDSSPRTGQLEITSATDFDPLDPRGENVEQPDLIPNLIDDDPDSSWQTETYFDSTVKKGGVGFIVELDEPAEIAAIELTTPVGGWTASVYVVEGDPPQDIEGWGEPIASIEDAPQGVVDVALGPDTGKAALVWFTHLAPIRDGRYAAQISDVTLRGR